MKDATEGQRPAILVLTTGGTIASNTSSGERGGVTPTLTGDDLLKQVPQLREIADIDAISVRQMPSSDLAVDDVKALAALIDEKSAEGYAGVVVTQGTDTLEETAFLLDLLVTGDVAVVVTGAMRNPTLPGADGPANLVAAVTVAAAPIARGLGCLVVFNDEIHAALFVRKTHTSSVATFRSPEVGPVGWISEGSPRIPMRQRGRRHIAGASSNGRTPAVALLTMGMGDDGRLVEALPMLGYAGLVVEAFGGGHVPSQVVPPLEALAESIPVVLASRTASGEVLRETYGFPGSERDLLARGLVSAGALDARKARLLLTLLLSRHDGRDVVVAAFEDFVTQTFAA